jgi:hypothetical protein
VIGQTLNAPIPLSDSGSHGVSQTRHDPLRSLALGFVEIDPGQ